MAAMAHDILDRLPHRDPFRFITRVERLVEGRNGHAVWAVLGDESFLAGHFPGAPLVPGVLLSEALAQLAGLVCFAHAKPCAGLHPQAGRLSQLDIRFDRPVAPPAEVQLFAEQSRRIGDLVQCDVRAEVGGRVVARGSLVLADVGHAPGATEKGAA